MLGTFASYRWLFLVGPEWVSCLKRKDISVSKTCSWDTESNSRHCSVFLKKTQKTFEASFFPGSGQALEDPRQQEHRMTSTMAATETKDPSHLMTPSGGTVSERGTQENTGHEGEPGTCVGEGGTRDPQRLCTFTACSTPFAPWDPQATQAVWAEATRTTDTSPASLPTSQ